jgi:hypothetical protein
MRRKVFLGTYPPECHQKEKDAIQITSLPVIDIPSGELIPGGLLLSRAHFRFSSTMQISIQKTIFTTCLILQPLTYAF